MVADGLTEETSAISSDRTRLAWLEARVPMKQRRSMYLTWQLERNRRSRRQREAFFVRSDLFRAILCMDWLIREDIWMLNGRAEDIPMYADSDRG